MAVHGLWDYTALGAPTESTDYLLDSYLRRRQWEWQQQAIHIVNSLAAALGDKPTRPGGADPLTRQAALGVLVSQRT